MLFYAVRCGGMVQYVHFFVLVHKKYIMVVLYVSRYVIFFANSMYSTRFYDTPSLRTLQLRVREFKPAPEKKSLVN